MAEVNYYLKEPASTKETIIYLFYHFNRQKLKFYTGEKILPTKWNPEKQRVKKNYEGASEINDILDKLEAGIKKNHRDGLTFDIPVTPEYLKEGLNKILQRDQKPQ